MKGKFNWGGGALGASVCGLIRQPSAEWVTAAEGSKQQPAHLFFKERVLLINQSVISPEATPDHW